MERYTAGKRPGKAPGRAPGRAPEKVHTPINRYTRQIHDRFVVTKMRRYFYYIDRFGNVYWTENKYDAWRTTDEAEAKRVARQMNAAVKTFNPITGGVE